MEGFEEAGEPLVDELLDLSESGVSGRRATGSAETREAGMEERISGLRSLRTVPDWETRDCTYRSFEENGLFGFEGPAVVDVEPELAAWLTFGAAGKEPARVAFLIAGTAALKRAVAWFEKLCSAFVAEADAVEMLDERDGEDDETAAPWHECTCG